MSPKNIRWFAERGLQSLVGELPGIIREARISLSRNDIASAIFVKGGAYKSYSKPREKLKRELTGFISKTAEKVFEKPTDPAEVPIYISCDDQVLCFRFVLQYTEAVLN